jgi:hypothetical protein
MTRDIDAALRRVHKAFNVGEMDRTDIDDLDLLESAGLMLRRKVTKHDTFDSLEPGEDVYEFNKSGVAKLKEMGLT